jgi:outer membrane protein, multidrug efflux system
MDNIQVKKSLSFLLIFIFLIAISSCSTLKPYSVPVVVPVEKLYRDVASSDTSNIAVIPWRSIYTDPKLIALIEEALEGNTDLQAASARIKIAEASLRQSRAAFFPTLTLSANAILENTDPKKGYQLTGSSSWEADIWGKLGNIKRANQDLFMKSEAYKRAVQTELIADLAMSYYTLLGFDAQLQVTEQTVAYRKSEVETIAVMKDNDMVTGADLVQSQANLYSAQIYVPDIKRNIYETENTISLLLGRTPGPIERGSLSEQTITVDLKTGIPAQLLANRPDVQAAEFQLRYGHEMTRAAQKAFYPSLTLSAASGGLQSVEVSKLFDAGSVFWSLVGGLTQPVLNHGLNRQRLNTAMAGEEEDLAMYKQVLLRSGSEVANAVYTYRSVTEKIELRDKQLGYLRKSVDYTTELLKYTSSTTYTNVLIAEMNLLSAELGSINDKQQQLQSVVTLYRSLGGGWK